MDGLGGPVLAAELDIGIDRRDVFCLRRQPRNADVEGRFLMPCDGMPVSADLDVPDARIGELRRPLAEGNLDSGEIDTAVEHMLLEALIEIDPALPADGVRDDGHDIKFRGIHKTLISSVEF